MDAPFRLSAVALVAAVLLAVPVLGQEAPSPDDVGVLPGDINNPLGGDKQPQGEPSDPVQTDQLDSPADVGGFDGLLDDLGFGGGLVLGIAVTLGVGLLLSAAVMGGTKFVTSENVLDNAARRQIFEYIKTNPGIHLRAAAQALELSTTNVLWHLRKLEDANLVASKKFEGYKVFYPSEGGAESRRRAIAASVLRNKHARAILEFVVGQPSAHQREIARSLGVNHGTVRWHLRKLNDAGLLLQVRKESHSMYYVSELGNQALEGFPATVAEGETTSAALAP